MQLNYFQFRYSQRVLRHFRLVIAVSQPNKIWGDGKTNAFGTKRTTEGDIKGAGIESYEMQPESFLSFMDELVNPSMSSTDQSVNGINLIS